MDGWRCSHLARRAAPSAVTSGHVVEATRPKALSHAECGASHDRAWTDASVNT
jgi:hypothetical protein